MVCDLCGRWLEQGVVSLVIHVEDEHPVAPAKRTAYNREYRRQLAGVTRQVFAEAS